MAPKHDLDGNTLHSQSAVDESKFDDGLRRLWEDDKYHDLTLVGTDGIQVTVNRAALATRNQVFDKMLYGNFSEATNKTIQLGFEGEVIKAVVEYLHTDSSAMLTPGNDIGQEGSKRLVRNLASLMEAAVYFNMPKMEASVHDFLSRYIQTKPDFAVFVLDFVAEENGPALPKDTKELALSLLCESLHRKDLSPAGNLSVHALEEVLKYEKSEMDEFQLFQLLLNWATNNAQDEQGIKDRMGCARELIRHISLCHIEPGKLSTVVATSNLVTTEQLLEAFKSQALAATQSTIRIGKVRSRLLWKSSCSSHFESYSDSDMLTIMDCYKLTIMDCPLITSGSYQWKIKVCNVAEDVALGIAIQPGELDFDNYCGSNSLTWGYDKRGRMYHKTKRISAKKHPTFGNGSIVTLRLDLKDDTDNGSLSASVDGGSPFFLCKNLNERLKNGNGFVPAASVNGGRIQLLQFKKAL